MISRKRPVLKALWALGVVTIVVYSITQFNPGDLVQLLTDKGAHFLAYFTTAVIGYLAATVRNHRIQIAAGMIALGLLLEVIQLYVPDRAFEWADWMTDIAGVALAYPVFALIRRWL